MKKKISDGVICVSSNFIYSCPLKLSDDYKEVMLGLFYNDYNMHFGNLFKAKNLRKKCEYITDEISAGRLGAEYGYVIFEHKNDNSSIFLPEFFNYYQFIHTLNEIKTRKDNNFSLFNEVNGYKNDLIDSSSYDTYDFVRMIYSDLCFDAQNDFIGYSVDRKTKAIKFMK